jgi:hypothetical protein
MKIGSSEHSENSARAAFYAVHSVEKNLRKSGPRVYNCRDASWMYGQAETPSNREIASQSVDELSDAARFLIEDGYRAVIGGLRIVV